MDRLLAEQAEQAVANDFETVSDVAADQKQTQSAVKVEAGMPEQLEGSYFTPPEQLLNDALEPAASADDGRSSMSEDTPRESSQPQAIGANHVATSDIAADAEEAPVASASSVPTSQRTCGKLVGLARQAAPLIRFALRQLHHACALVNRPVARLSPPTRNTIGFVGLVTLCNAGIVAIGKLIFVLFST